MAPRAEALDPAAAPSASGLGRRALSLGAASALDYAIQFLLPVVLVRCLDPEAFGQYRLLWLAAGTVMAVITQSMAGSLYYFLPRSGPQARRLYVNQVLLFLVAAGLAGAWAVSAWNPWLPGSLSGLAAHGWLVPAFVALWVMSSLLDMLPTIEERIAWQARSTVGLSLLRALALSLAAWLTGELWPVLAVLLAFVAFKYAVLLGYVARFHGLGGPWFSRAAFADQLRHAAPFGAAGALYGLRAQADQWVAAALFTVGAFASFSIAAVLAPLVNLCRQSVAYAFLPSMSRLQAGGDAAGALALNRRANVLVVRLLYPVLVAMFVYAEDVVGLVYTEAYLDAAPAMRVYIAGLAGLAVELVSLMLILRQGDYAMRVNLMMLPLSVAVSWLLASRVGLAGAAVGSVLAIYIDFAITLRRVSGCLGVPVARLQDWRAIGTAGACALAAGLLAWGANHAGLAALPVMARLAAGFALVGAAYVGLQLLLLRGAREEGRT